MNDEKTAFEVALDESAKPNYLGSQDVVDQFVRSFLSEALDRRVNASNDDEQKCLVQDMISCEQAAKVFLGENPDYTGMDKWNAPGFIDQFMADQLNIEDKDHHTRMDMFFMLILLDLFKMCEQVASGATEDFQSHTDAIVQAYTSLLLGLPLVKDVTS